MCGTAKYLAATSARVGDAPKSNEHFLTIGPNKTYLFMTMNIQRIKFFRRNIPNFVCAPGCHDCCGPVTTSAEEMSWLPIKTREEHDAAFDNLNCPHLGKAGCQVYEDRPLICRLFGTTPSLACPNGCKPEVMIAPGIEKRLYKFFSATRQVLV